MLRSITLGLTLCAAAPLAAKAPDTLGAVAEAYVKLSLEAGEREEGYVDAYFGPPAWAAAAKAKPRTVPQLEADARALAARAEAIPAARLQPIERKRRAFLIGQLRAAATRMAMAGGKQFSFDEEAIGLFGVKPVLTPLTALDPLLARLDQLLPGPAPLADRYTAWRAASVIPLDRVKPVTALAIAECRRRTVAHIPLPAGERFTLGVARDKPWGAYNYYKGRFTSHIDVNVDRPVTVAAAVDYGCHEGYPGHHVYNMLLERDLLRKRGWVEFSIYPLYGPQSLIAEGSGNYGVEIAFPGDQQAAYERATLYPAAGLTPPTGRTAEIAAIRAELGKARFTIAREYLDGRIDRAQALALTGKYMLLKPEEAAASLRFTDHYRSSVINYGYGLELVRAAVNAAGPGANARWARLRTLLSEPTTPADLIALAARPVGGTVAAR